MILDKPNHRPLVLGIDTGGTYTDGILLDYHKREVLAAHKSLTTRRDLSIGIEAVIQGIRIQDPTDIQMVSVSTTLATNAIAEGKRTRVALLLIGYDPELITAYKMEGRFATPRFYYISGGHDLHGREKEPLDLSALLAKVTEFKFDTDAIAVSGYFSPLNPEHELRAFKEISSICDLPVVLGHQLSTRLGSVERATTAALNASLLGVLRDFVVAVRRAMARRRIVSPLMVVRGDGTLMSDEFATRTPVETIHSGPAASAIGGRFLSGHDNALVVDIGGTTTDFALIEGGEVAVSVEGATVLHYKTAVQAANLHSIALGGDSHITLDRENRIAIGPERVVPLACLADQYPGVLEQMEALSKKGASQVPPDWLEFWFLQRVPDDAASLTTNQEKALVTFLGDGPKPLPAILEHLNLFHKMQVTAGDAFRREIIGISGFTPTDLFHVENRYNVWNTATAVLALEMFCRYQLWAPDKFRQRVWSDITQHIVHAIVTFLSGKSLDLPTHPENGDIGSWFFFNGLKGGHPRLETRFRLKQPLIGIGAPAGILLKNVADVLHTDLILPPHHQVANAVGAVAGSVMVAEEMLVYPRVSSGGAEVIGYYVQRKDDRRLFKDQDEALAYARNLSRERAMGAALRSGADNPQVTINETSDGLDTYRITAKAVGSPSLTPGGQPPGEIH